MDVSERITRGIAYSRHRQQPVNTVSAYKHITQELPGIELCMCSVLITDKVV